MQAQTTQQFFQVDGNGNPSYTIKDGGTLKKKVQPMAANKVPRLPNEKPRGTTAPGTYDLPGDIAGTNKRKHFLRKTVAERLGEMGIHEIQGNEFETSEFDMDSMQPEVQEQDLNALKDPFDKPAANMMKKVRGTAKWSQLVETKPTFPPKHKVLFMNQDKDTAP